MIQQPDLFEIVDNVGEMSLVMPRQSIQSNLSPVNFISPMDQPTWMGATSNPLQPVAYQTFEIEDEPQIVAPIVRSPALKYDTSGTTALLPVRSPPIQYETVAVAPRRQSIPASSVAVQTAPIAVQSNPVVRLSQTTPTVTAAIPTVSATVAAMPTVTAMPAIPTITAMPAMPTIRTVVTTKPATRIIAAQPRRSIVVSEPMIRIAPQPSVIRIPAVVRRF